MKLLTLISRLLITGSIKKSTPVTKLIKAAIYNPNDLKHHSLNYLTKAVTPPEWKQLKRSVNKVKRFKKFFD